MKSLAGNSGVPYNNVVCVSIGPGGSGKTGLRLAMQNRPLPDTRQSTNGGERELRVVKLRRGEMDSFSEDAPLTQLQRALAQELRLQRHKAAGQRLAELGEAALDDIMRRATETTMHKDVHEARQEARRAAVVALQVLGADDDDDWDRLSEGDFEDDFEVPEGDTVLSPAQAQAARHAAYASSKALDLSEAVAKATAAVRAGQHREAAPAAGAAAGAADNSTDARQQTQPPQISFARDGDTVLAHIKGEEAQNHTEGVHVTFFDMGGQPEFASLAAEFLRRRGIYSSVFFLVYHCPKFLSLFYFLKIQPRYHHRVLAPG